jgi:hypothetical protein
MLGKFIAPDWRDGSQYPDPQNTSPSQWAWEFLRRNADYQADWLHYVIQHQKIWAKHPETKDYLEWYLERTEVARKTLRAKFATKADYEEYRKRTRDRLCEIERAESFLYVFDPPRLEGESDFQHLQRTGEYARTLLADSLAEKWGLKTIQPPNCRDATFFFGAWFKKTLGDGVSQLSRHYWLNLEGVPSKKRQDRATELINFMRQEYFEKPEIEVLGFDLTLPIDAQVERATKYLHQEQKRRASAGEITKITQKRYQSREYPKYLRAYDAQAAGIAPNDIVKTLLPKEVANNTAAGGYAPRAKIINWIDSAKKLVKCDYKFVPLAANKASS